MKKIALIGAAAAAMALMSTGGASAQGVGVGVGPGGVYVGTDSGYRGDRYYDRGYRRSYNEYRGDRVIVRDRWDRPRRDRVYIERD